MKTLIKKVLAIIAIMIISSISISAQSTSKAMNDADLKKMIVGTWLSNDEEIKMVVCADGSIKSYEKWGDEYDEQFTGKWSLANKSLQIEVDGERQTMKIKSLDEKNLVMTDSEGDLVFRRGK